jgi:hypothetical protein
MRCGLDGDFLMDRGGHGDALSFDDVLRAI